MNQETITPLTDRWPCRESQLKQLDAFLSVGTGHADNFLADHVVCILTKPASNAQPKITRHIRSPSHWQEQHYPGIS